MINSFCYLLDIHCKLRYNIDRDYTAPSEASVHREAYHVREHMV